MAFDVESQSGGEKCEEESGDAGSSDEEYEGSHQQRQHREELEFVSQQQRKYDLMGSYVLPPDAPEFRVFIWNKDRSIFPRHSADFQMVPFFGRSLSSSSSSS